ncbi:peptide chain release factor N(5)-glutamine methyltransferase [Lentisphaerota bacterium WC36G]|nr:peptide chain release factor N(5)-glutamine methyltransferase [Lentisphaerae bacterium WC36]
MKLQDAFRQCVKILQEGKFADLARNDAALIVSEVTSIKHNQILFSDYILNESKQKKIFKWSEKRANGEPLQYLFGHTFFRNLNLDVASGVLIPRPETEILCQYVIDKVEKNGTVLDIGTGSGVIALSIATERNDCRITAVEKSSKAIIIAKQNFKKYQSQCYNNECINLIKSDLFSALDNNQKFSAITANLPYVTAEEYAILPFDVKNYEPIEALVADDEGLALIKRTILEAPSHLKKNGFIVFEFGDLQTDAVYGLLKSSNKYQKIEIFSDLNNIERFIAAYV